MSVTDILVIVNLLLLVVVLIKLFTGNKPVDTDSMVSSVKDGINASQRELREELANSITSANRLMSDNITDIQKAMGTAQSEQLSQMKTDMRDSLEAIRQIVDSGLQTTLTTMLKTVNDTMKNMSDTMAGNFSTMGQQMSENQTDIGKKVNDQLLTLENRLKTLESSNNERLEAIKRTVSEHLNNLSEANQKKLDTIQSMVSDKLENNLRESFKLVSEQLEQVYKGLGEMQTVASGVGDLKKILSNVKTRGIMGEIQLGMILDEILAPEQYDHEVATIPGSQFHVEYAIKLPGSDGNGMVYLPIDSKFPGDTFSMLQDAYESGDGARISEAKKQLEAVIKKCAGDIRQKYVEPPYTTNFGIMFLPFEGLYAEVVNSGLTGILQQEYNVTVAGPSTMAAMLNSLQMGFRTLAIQKRSSEVWKILGETKGEFMKFEKALKAAQDKITKAGEELDNLVGRRTRAINRKLRSVETLESSEVFADELLQETDDDE